MPPNYLPKRHWTPTYLRDRIIEGRYRHAHPDEPWLTAAAVDLLSAWLRPDDVAVEFGSGASTRWFARRVGSLISVEDDPKWFRRVEPTVLPLGVDYRLCSTRAEYTSLLRDLPSSSIDFALVDGSYRDECAIGLVPAMKVGGLLAVDNANWYINRPHQPSTTVGALSQRNDGWAHFEALTEEWRWIWSTNGVTDTAFFIRTQ